MGGEGRLWEDERNSQPEPLEDNKKQESEPGTEGSPNQNHRKPIAEQSREEESEIHAPRNIPTQDARWRTGKFETTLRRPTTIQLSGGRYPVPDASRLWMRVLQR
jgi:hypothetical protein